MDINEVESRNLNQDLKILLVDDDERQLRALETLISKLDLEIIKATSGQEALKLMLHNQFIMKLFNQYYL